MSFIRTIAFSWILLQLTVHSNAAVIAYWNFNNLTITTANTPGHGDVPVSILSDIGTATINLTPFGGTIDDFAGTNQNALNSDTAGNALSLIAASGSPYPGNDTSITIQISMTDSLNPILSFTTQRTATGFVSNQLAYSTDGSQFTDFSTPYTPTTSFTQQTLDLSSVDALDNAATAYFRITFSGATGATGNNRIDNIQIQAIPECSVFAMGCMGISLIFRRRRG